MILTPVKHSRVTKFSLTTNMNDTGFCSVVLQTVCSYMQKRCELFRFLVPFFFLSRMMLLEAYFRLQGWFH